MKDERLKMKCPLTWPLPRERGNVGMRFFLPLTWPLPPGRGMYVVGGACEGRGKIMCAYFYEDLMGISKKRCNFVP